MKLAKFNSNNTKQGEVELPAQFSEQVRPDLIRRAVLALQAAARQPYGAKPDAGMRHSAELSRRRHDYRGSYGFGISRVPRKIMSRRGTRMNWVGAVAPGTVGGRRAHPPKAEKVWEQKLNKKENRKAIRSAMAATVNKELVAQRGHRVPENYPFIVDNSFESLSKTKQVRDALQAIGFAEEISRSATKTIRAGKGKSRGRKYKKRTGILIVVGEECPLSKAARNISGLDVVPINAINAQLLAPGTHPGRLTLWSENARATLKEKRLFV